MPLGDFSLTHTSLFFKTSYDLFKMSPLKVTLPYALILVTANSAKLQPIWPIRLDDIFRAQTFND